MTDQVNTERELRDLVIRLRSEHRGLDEKITALEDSGSGDQLQIKRLKKQKLALKDRISSIEGNLRPDIIA